MSKHQESTSPETHGYGNPGDKKEPWICGKLRPFVDDSQHMSNSDQGKEHACRDEVGFHESFPVWGSPESSPVPLTLQNEPRATVPGWARDGRRVGSILHVSRFVE